MIAFKDVNEALFCEVRGRETEKMKILLVDDHQLLRDGMSMLLHGKHGDALELLYAENGCAALGLAEAHADLELILLDIDLPDIHGFQVLKELRKKYSASPVLVLSGNTELQFVRKCIELGASGFLPKTSSGRQMLAVIDLVLNGGSYIPPEIMQAGIETQCQSPVSLTERQLGVLVLLQKGLSNKSIAQTLEISLPTVKTHVREILRKLTVNNRTEAVNEAQLLHLI